jgi:hypothetical protein
MPVLGEAPTFVQEVRAATEWKWMPQGSANVKRTVLVGQ